MRKPATRVILTGTGADGSAGGAATAARFAAEPRAGESPIDPIRSSEAQVASLARAHSSRALQYKPSRRLGIGKPIASPRFEEH